MVNHSPRGPGDRSTSTHSDSRTARSPSGSAASAASACSSGPRISPNDAYAGRPLAAPPNSTDTGSPDALPMMSQSAASSGQYRPAWKLIVSSTATCAAIRSGSRPTNSSANGSKPSMVSPEPKPVMPSSVSPQPVKPDRGDLHGRAGAATAGAKYGLTGR